MLQSSVSCHEGWANIQYFIVNLLNLTSIVTLMLTEAHRLRDDVAEDTESEFTTTGGLVSKKSQGRGLSRFSTPQTPHGLI